MSTREPGSHGELHELDSAHSNATIFFVLGAIFAPGVFATLSLVAINVLSWCREVDTKWWTFTCTFVLSSVAGIIFPLSLGILDPKGWAIALIRMGAMLLGTAITITLVLLLE